MIHRTYSIWQFRNRPRRLGELHGYMCHSARQ